MFAISIFVLAAIFPARLSGNQIDVIRDYWGIAHIYADNDLELFFGAGYATAEDRMFQMELSRRKVAGKLAESMGRTGWNRTSSCVHSDSTNMRRNFLMF